VLNKELISQTIQPVHLHDDVSRVLQYMSDFHVAHLPIVSDDKYIGLISEDDLLNAGADSQEIIALSHSFIKPAVKSAEHFTRALQLVVEQHISVVPVVDEQDELLGVIEASELLRQAGAHIGVNEQGGIIVLDIEQKDFSFSEISRLVETHDAQITQLNTSVDPLTGNTVVTIKINKKEISDVVATLQRFEYNVRYYFGEEMFENQLRNNYENLMNYLRI
jgi:acetoin utilization protein AcuB